MKQFSRFMLGLFCLGCVVFALSQSVTFKPFVRPGQELEYKRVLAAINTPAVDPNALLRPRLICREGHHQFGEMPPLSSASKTFTLHNAGNQPLIIKGGKTSCVCTASDVETTEVAPGEEHQITLTWFTRPGDKHFEQTASILTNDPDQQELILRVSGTVQTLLGITPQPIIIDGLSPDGSSSREFSLFSDVWEHFTIDRIETTSPALACEELNDPLVLPKSIKRMKSVKSFRLTTSAVTPERIRLYVNPEPAWLAEQLSTTATELGHDSFNLQADGTMLVELPITTRELKRLSLYSPLIKEAESKIIDLGKCRVRQSDQLRFVVICRIRGDLAPTALEASLEGIPGVSVQVERIEPTSAKSHLSYRIVIYSDAPLRPGIFDRLTPGILRIRAPGLPGEEELEFRVFFDVLADQA